MKGHQGFIKGRSGNPGGQSKSHVAAQRELARLIAYETDGFGELVAFLLRVARGEEPNMKSERTRAWAVDQLLDRGAGRAPMHIDFTTDAPRAQVNYSALSDAELDAYEAITKKLLGARSPVPSTAAPVMPPGAAGDADPVH